MYGDNQGATRTMAKKQRTVQLPESILDLADAHEKATGVRFNRIILAALLKYYFDEFHQPHLGTPPSPDPVWTQLAVELERGGLSIGDIPETLLTSLFETNEKGFALPKDTLEAAKERRRGWRNAIHDCEAIEALIDYIGWGSKRTK